VIVVTQSAADPEALTQQPGLLASLTDNFTGFAIHRQHAPEVRDWLAKLMGTSAIWQSTDQTVGHGAAHSGRGSRRRVRLFRVGADVFAQLQRGEAIIHSTLAGSPQRTHVLRAHVPTRPRRGSGTTKARLRDRYLPSRHARADRHRQPAKRAQAAAGCKGDGPRATTTEALDNV
jgi:hypothetical protein